MKKSLIILLTFTLLIFSGCSKENTVDAPSGTVGVTNDALSFSICYPENWDCHQNDGLILVAPPSTSESKASISATESPTQSEEITLTGYWDEQKVDLAETFNNFTVNSTSETELDGVTALKVSYNASVNGTAYKFVQIFAVNNYKIYTVTFTAEESEFADMVSYLDTVAENFSFK